MMRPGDKVAFAAAVVKRCGYDKRTADARGVVVEIDGRVAAVDFAGTLDSDDGRAVRWVPVANLTRVMANGVIFS